MEFGQSHVMLDGCRVPSPISGFLHAIYFFYLMLDWQSRNYFTCIRMLILLLLLWSLSSSVQDQNSYDHERSSEVSGRLKVCLILF